MLSIGKIDGMDNVLSQLNSFSRTVGRSMLSELKLTGRNVAVSLARGTLPRGLDKQAQKQGKKSVRRDINRIFLTPGEVFDRIYLDSDRRKFWSAYRRNDIPAMEKAAEEGIASITIIRSPKKDQHWNRKQVFVSSPTDRERYIRNVEKQVGKAKAGWDAAIQDLGSSHRKIPVWASIQKHPDASGRAIINEDLFRPEVTIENDVSYIEDAMRGTSIYETLRIAEKRLLNRMRIIISKAIRDIRSVA